MVPISGSDNPRTLARRRSPPAGRLRSQLHAGQNHGTSMAPATASGRIGGKACARLARNSTRPTATERSLERDWYAGDASEVDLNGENKSACPTPLTAAGSPVCTAGRERCRTYRRLAAELNGFQLIGMMCVSK